MVSIQNAAAYGALDNGPSIIAYARLWFTLPYAFLTVPITTAMFTEISEMHANGNMRGFKRGIISGTNQIVFFMVPFALYLIVFAEPLVTLYHIGAFTEDNISQIALYLAALALSLPFYGINTYLQKVFSAMRIMGRYAVMMVACIAFQIGFIAIFATRIGGPLNIGMPGDRAERNGILSCPGHRLLRLSPQNDGRARIEKHRRLVFEVFPSGPSWAHPSERSSSRGSRQPRSLNGSIPNALICIFCGGLLALIVTFGLAIKLKLSEASMVSSLIEKVARRFKRKTTELSAGNDEAALDSASANTDTHDDIQHLDASSAQNNDVVARCGVEAFAEDLDSEVVLPLGKHGGASTRCARCIASGARTPCRHAQHRAGF